MEIMKQIYEYNVVDSIENHNMEVYSYKCK